VHLRLTFPDAYFVLFSIVQVAALFRRDGLVRVKRILPQKIAEAQQRGLSK